jgi:hypothetical protein
VKVKILKTGKVEDINSSYASRLIEQGKAILQEEAKKEAEKPAAKKG